MNNQEERISRYAATLGRRAFLEAMLMSTRVPARTGFQGLRTVILDEVHAFAGSGRGAHLATVLERTRERR